MQVSKRKFTLSILAMFLIGSLLTGVFVYASIPSQTLYLSGGVYPRGAYTIWQESGTYYSKTDAGAIAFNGVNASEIIQNSIDALPSNGGKIVLLGNITLSTRILLNDNSIEICGGNLANDHYFTRDGTYNGVTNKTETVIFAEDITAFHIGENAFVFGISIRNLLISGNNTDAVLTVLEFSDGAGINITRGNTITIENVQIVGKEYGIYCSTGSFAYDKVIDILSVDNLYLSFNEYGIWSDGWVANSDFRNIRGYLNQKGLIHGNFQYECYFETISSQNDNNNCSDVRDTPIYISTARDVMLTHISIQGDNNPPIARSLMYFDLGNTTFGYGAEVILNDVVLLGCNGTAINVQGSTGEINRLTINDLYAGIGNPYSFYGGLARIESSIIKVETVGSNDTQVIVNGGFVNSSVSEKNWWFYSDNSANQIITRNVRGITDIGEKNLVFTGSAFPDGLYAMGYMGTSSTPANNTEYIMSGTSALVTMSGGSGVSVNVKDQVGNVVVSGASSFDGFYLPNGYKMNFTFAALPSIDVFYCD